MGQCAYKVCCAQQSWDIVNYLLLQVGTLLACLSPLVARWSVAAVSHDWSVHEIWTAFKLLIMMSLQPSAISAPPSPNCPLSLLLLCSVYSAGWGWGTWEGSFIYALHTVKEALLDVLQVVLCNIDGHSESQRHVCRSTGEFSCMPGIHEDIEGPLSRSVNQLLFVSAMHRRFLKQSHQMCCVVSVFTGVAWRMMCEQEISLLLLIKHCLYFISAPTI